MEKVKRNSSIWGKFKKPQEEQPQPPPVERKKSIKNIFKKPSNSALNSETSNLNSSPINFPQLFKRASTIDSHHLSRSNTFEAKTKSIFASFGRSTKEVKPAINVLHDHDAASKVAEKSIVVKDFGGVKKGYIGKMEDYDERVEKITNLLIGQSSEATLEEGQSAVESSAKLKESRKSVKFSVVFDPDVSGSDSERKDSFGLPLESYFTVPNIVSNGYSEEDVFASEVGFQDDTYTHRHSFDDNSQSSASKPISIPSQFSLSRSIRQTPPFGKSTTTEGSSSDSTYGLTLSRYLTAPAILITNDEGLSYAPSSSSTSSLNIFDEPKYEIKGNSPRLTIPPFKRPEMPDIEVEVGPGPAETTDRSGNNNNGSDGEIFLDFGSHNSTEIMVQSPDVLDIPMSFGHLRNSSSTSVASTRSKLTAGLAKFKPEKNPVKLNANFLHPDWVHRRSSINREDKTEAMLFAAEFLKGRKVMRDESSFEVEIA
ncbi:hypothetical protein HK098_006978 [Nowakowskiella sp. JEL0407]|nr:hypothetical protein HK098_006978 [Nowakowskiella sp. JEL0407]